MTESNIDWTDESEVAARLVEQFGVALAQMIAIYDRDGRYDEFVAGFRGGRFSLALDRDGLTVRESADVPPPTAN